MDELSFQGSCLCGGVRYAIRAKPQRFYHCHCQRCRKASGAGHSSNLMVEAAALTWLQGEPYLRRFDVPQAERFYTLFCSRCGSPMPRRVPQIDAVVIPAGSLDHEPPIKPQARIFWDSRAGWSCEDDLTRYARYPDRP